MLRDGNILVRKIKNNLYEVELLISTETNKVSIANKCKINDCIEF